MSDLNEKELLAFLKWVRGKWQLGLKEKGKQAIRQLEQMVGGFDSNGFVTVKTMEHKVHLAHQKGIKEGQKIIEDSNLVRKEEG